MNTNDVIYDKTPWGYQRVLAETEAFKVTEWVIETGGSFYSDLPGDYQIHFVVVEGYPYIDTIDNVCQMEPGDSMDVEDQPYEISNVKPLPAVIIVTEFFDDESPLSMNDNAFVESQSAELAA